MRTTRFITLAAIALAVVSVTVPALAQSGGNGERRSRDREVRAAQSGDQGRQARGSDAVRRQTPDAYSARASGSDDRASPAAGGSPRGSDNRSDAQSRSNADGHDNRAYANQRHDNRAYGNQRYSNRAYDNRGHGNAGYGNPGYGARGYDTRAYGYGGYGAYGGYDWNRYGWYGSYDRHAWHNQVHVGLGVSLFAGNPFSFRFACGWQPGFRYRYAVVPGMAYGGMSFLLNPDDAEVYVDGQFVGIARDFGGQPVPVPAGRHRIELYAPGFGPVAFDVDVRPGQVIPYRGSLYPVY